MKRNKYISSSLFFLISSFFFCTNILGVNLEEHKYGLNVYKKGNCMGCHSWDGKGGKSLSTEHNDKILDDYFFNLSEVFKLIKDCEEDKSNINDLLQGPVCHSGFKRLN